MVGARYEGVEKALTLNPSPSRERNFLPFAISEATGEGAGDEGKIILRSTF